MMKNFINNIWLNKLGFVIVVLVFNFTSCKTYFENLEYEELTFYFPDFNLYSAQNNEQNDIVVSRWLVEIYSKDYDTKFFTTEKSVSVKVQKNEPLCILASPITTFSTKDNADIGSIPFFETQIFKPAGTIYPYSPETQNQLLWEKGFSATVMKLLWNSKKETNYDTNYINNFIASFNWKKFQEVQDEKNQQEFYNPWHIDLQPLLEELCAKEFSSSFLTTKGVYSFPLETYFKDAKTVYSLYVPENKIINEQKIFFAKKNELNSFLVDNFCVGVVSFDSIKNVSITNVSVPIFNEEL